MRVFERHPTQDRVLYGFVVFIIKNHCQKQYSDNVKSFDDSYLQHVLSCLALRRLVVQTRRLLNESNGSNSRAAGQLDHYVAAQGFYVDCYHKRYRSNAHTLLSYFRMICFFYMDCYYCKAH